MEVKSAEEKDKEKFLQVIRETLEKLVKEGIDQKAIAAGINYLEFRFRESDYGSYPRGLMYSIDVCESWLYDDNKPFVHLEKLKAFDELKKEAGEGLFEQLIQETMLDNRTVLWYWECRKKDLQQRRRRRQKRSWLPIKPLCLGNSWKNWWRKPEN